MTKNEGVLLVVSGADLREFAMAVAGEIKATPNKDDEKMYTPAEFAKMKGVSKVTLWRWCKAGILTPTKTGGKTYYKESNLKVMEG